MVTISQDDLEIGSKNEAKATPDELQANEKLSVDIDSEHRSVAGREITNHAEDI